MIIPKQKRKRTENLFHKKIRKEFNINYRSYYYMCLEEEYISKIVDFVKQETIQETSNYYQEQIKEIFKEIEIFENPYPKDIFLWDNKEKLDFNRGRFNQHCFEIVENTKRSLIKELKEKFQRRKDDKTNKNMDS